MEGIVILICIAISVLCYKKISTRCRNKGRGGLRVFFTALTSSFFIFIIAMGIGVANFFPKTESNNTVGYTNHETSVIYNCILNVNMDNVRKTVKGNEFNDSSLAYSLSDSELGVMLITSSRKLYKTYPVTEQTSDGNTYSDEKETFLVSVPYNGIITVTYYNNNEPKILNNQVCNEYKQ